MEVHERLREARVKAGYASAADFARSAGIPYGTYSGHENGHRGIKNEDLFDYARKLKVSLTWLLFGQTIEEYDHNIAWHVGSVGNHQLGNVQVFDPPRLDMKISKPDFLPDTTGAYLTVDGPYLSAAIEEGSIIFCDPDLHYPKAAHHGRLCVCFLRDSRALIRTIYPSADEGLFDLEPMGSRLERSQDVVSISPVWLIATPVIVEFIRNFSEAVFRSIPAEEIERLSKSPPVFKPK